MAWSGARTSASENLLIDVDKRVPSNLVLEIISGDNGIFLDYIRDESKAKVVFVPSGGRGGRPCLQITGKPDEVKSAMEMAQNLVDEVIDDLKALEKDCVNDSPAPAAVEVVKVPVETEKTEAAPVIQKQKTNWADEVDSGDEWTTIEKKPRASPALGKAGRLPTKGKGDKGGDKGEKGAKGEQGKGKGKGKEGKASPTTKGQTPLTGTGQPRRWEDLRSASQTPSASAQMPVARPGKKAWANENGDKPDEAGSGMELHRLLDTALEKLTVPGEGSEPKAPKTSWASMGSPEVSPSGDPKLDLDEELDATPPARGDSPKSKASPSASTGPKAKGQASPDSSWDKKGGKGKGKDGKDGKGKGAAKGKGVVRTYEPEIVTEEEQAAQRRKIEEKEKERLAKQLEAQRKYAEEQGKAQEPGKSARKEPKKPAKPADDDEDVPTSSLADSTKEVLKCRKKIREMESILALQEAGKTLDPAQVKKLSGLADVRAALTAAEAVETERLEGIRREEEARLAAEREAEAAQAAEEARQLAAKAEHDLRMAEERRKAEAVQAEAVREANELAARAAQKLEGKSAPSKSERQAAPASAPAPSAPAPAPAAAPEPSKPPAPAADRAPVERTVDPRLSNLSPAEVKQYKLAQRKLREIEELEKLKRSTLNEGQKEKIRRKPELLAQVEQLVPSGEGEAEAEEAPAEEPADEAPAPAEEAPPAAVPVADDDEDDEPANGHAVVRRVAPALNPYKDLAQKKAKKPKEKEPKPVKAAVPATLQEVKVWPWYWVYLPKWVKRWCRNRADAELAGRGNSGKYN